MAEKYNFCFHNSYIDILEHEHLCFVLFITLYTQYHFQLSTVLKPCSSTKRYQEPYSNKIYNYPTVFYRINFKEDSIMKSSHHPLDNVHKFDSYTNC